MHGSLPALPRVPQTLPSSSAGMQPRSTRFLRPPGSWMLPEVHPRVRSEGVEGFKVSSWGMTEPSHPQHWAFPICQTEACTQDGNVCIIPDLRKKGLPSCHLPKTNLILLLHPHTSAAFMKWLPFYDLLCRKCSHRKAPNTPKLMLRKVPVR